MAASVRSISSHGEFESDAKAALRLEWLSRHRVPEDFYRLWDLYWDDLGPLAVVPASVHDMEEVLVR